MELLSPKDLKKIFPLSQRGAAYIQESRIVVQKIFERQDPRLLLIVGPCSIHSIEEALEYATALKKLSSQVEDHCFIILRAYIEKPRTHMGWKGLVHDPHLNESHDIEQGLTLARNFLVQLAEMALPAATEFLTPHLAPYIEDLITWGCIGARTSASQPHRILASHLPMPIGFKNSVDGNIDCAIHGVSLARRPHRFMHLDDNGKIHVTNSSGNPFAHVILRGSSNKTNYDPLSIQQTLTQMRLLELPPRILIDCSHGNCQGQYFKQKEVFAHVLEEYKKNPQILGMMLESNLEASSQKIPNQLSDLQRGVSITDPCLDFSMTEELISALASPIVMSCTQN